MRKPVRRPVVDKKKVKADLTPRLLSVLNLLLEGFSEKEIARRLGLSIHTIHGYARSIYDHYGAGGRVEFMAWWIHSLLVAIAERNETGGRRRDASLAGAGQQAAAARVRRSLRARALWP